MIPKPGKTELRPLSVGSPRDKIVQKALQLILEGIFDPTFLDCSHGFRPGFSVYTALKRLYLVGSHYRWVVQGDISKCFDTIPHNIILDRLNDKIKCVKTLDLIRKLITVGWIDPNNNRHIKQLIGTPQGSLISPVLCNIVLHQFDSFIKNSLIPEFSKGIARKGNPAYNSLAWSIGKTNCLKERKEIRNRMRNMPSKLQMDPNYSKMKYIRYADDFIILFDGPFSETT